MPKDDDDDLNIPRTTSEDVTPRAKHSHRSITPSEVESIVQAQAEANARFAASQTRASQLDWVRLQMVELVGSDGDGGKVQLMEARLTTVENTTKANVDAIEKLTEFKSRLVWLGGLALTIGGVLAAVASKVIDHLWK